MLAVQNMYCAACPHTVKASLEAVPGVTKVVVSFKEKTAVVTYDDEKSDTSFLEDLRSKIALRSSTGTKSGLVDSVVDRTNFRTASFAEPSFPDGSGSA